MNRNQMIEHQHRYPSNPSFPIPNDRDAMIARATVIGRELHKAGYDVDNVWWTALAPLTPAERYEVREECKENDDV